MTHIDTAKAARAAAADPRLSDIGSGASPRPAAKRTIRRSLFRATFGAAFLVGALAVAGAAYETIASTGDAIAFPVPGKLIDVGGYRLHIDCRGKGSPTVVLDAGLGGSSLDWTLVQQQLASTTQVCAYDRAGMGWSEIGPSRPRTPDRIAEELHLLLAGAGIRPPYVLVGHSLAGKNIRMFAFAHPEEVGGLVLVDARSERMDMQASSSDADGLTSAFKAQGVAFTIARSLGLARLFGASLLGPPEVAGDTAVKMALFQTQPSAVTETVNEGAARAADDDLLARTSLGDLPLIVIAAEQNMAGLPGWEDAQQGLSQLSTKGQLVVAKGSGHYVQLEQPQLVIDAVQTVITASQRDL